MIYPSMGLKNSPWRVLVTRVALKPTGLGVNDNVFLLYKSMRTILQLGFKMKNKESSKC